MGTGLNWTECLQSAPTWDWSLTGKERLPQTLLAAACFTLVTPNLKYLPPLATHTHACMHAHTHTHTCTHAHTHHTHTHTCSTHTHTHTHTHSHTHTHTHTHTQFTHWKSWTVLLLEFPHQSNEKGLLALVGRFHTEQNPGITTPHSSSSPPPPSPPPPPLNTAWYLLRVDPW